MVYHRRYRSRSREPENVGRNVDVFAPLPNRQRIQTSVRSQFGFNDTGTSSNFHQAPTRQRLTTCVKEINATTSSPQKRARSVPSDDDDEILPKPGRGRSPFNRYMPPKSYARRSADPEYYPPGQYHRHAYSQNNRNAERNSPVRNSSIYYHSF